MKQVCGAKSWDLCQGSVSQHCQVENQKCHMMEYVLDSRRAHLFRAWCEMGLSIFLLLAGQPAEPSDHCSVQVRRFSYSVAEFHKKVWHFSPCLEIL